MVTRPGWSGDNTTYIAYMLPIYIYYILTSSILWIGLDGACLDMGFSLFTFVVPPKFCSILDF